MTAQGLAANIEKAFVDAISPQSAAQLLNGLRPGWTKEIKRLMGDLQPMAMEIEWAVAPSSVVDGDFQKLVQARADVRVWVATCANKDDVNLHVANCEEQIRCFGGTQPNDQYVLLFFEWLTKTAVLKRLP